MTRIHSNLTYNKNNKNLYKSSSDHHHHGRWYANVSSCPNGRNGCPCCWWRARSVPEHAQEPHRPEGTEENDANPTFSLRFLRIQAKRPSSREVERCQVKKKYHLRQQTLKNRHFSPPIVSIPVLFKTFFLSWQ